MILSEKAQNRSAHSAAKRPYLRFWPEPMIRQYYDGSAYRSLVPAKVAHFKFYAKLRGYGTWKAYMDEYWLPCNVGRDTSAVLRL